MWIEILFWRFNYYEQGDLIIMSKLCIVQDCGYLNRMFFAGDVVNNPEPALVKALLSGISGGCPVAVLKDDPEVTVPEVTVPEVTVESVEDSQPQMGDALKEQKEAAVVAPSPSSEVTEPLKEGESAKRNVYTSEELDKCKTSGLCDLAASLNIEKYYEKSKSELVKEIMQRTAVER